MDPTVRNQEQGKGVVCQRVGWVLVPRSQPMDEGWVGENEGEQMGCDMRFAIVNEPWIGTGNPTWKGWK
jgi:hypothetical protein